MAASNGMKDYISEEFKKMGCDQSVLNLVSYLVSLDKDFTIINNIKRIKDEYDDSFHRVAQANRKLDDVLEANSFIGTKLKGGGKLVYVADLSGLLSTDLDLHESLEGDGIVLFKIDPKKSKCYSINLIDSEISPIQSDEVTVLYGQRQEGKSYLPDENGKYLDFLRDFLENFGKTFESKMGRGDLNVYTKANGNVIIWNKDGSVADVGKLALLREVDGVFRIFYGRVTVLPAFGDDGSGRAYNHISFRDEHLSIPDEYEVMSNSDVKKRAAIKLLSNLDVNHFPIVRKMGNRGFAI